jgi:hypothetical protein
MKPKVNSGHLAPDLLAQSGSGRQVFGCRQSGEDNGLVGEIAVFTLSFDSLKVIYIPVAPQTNSNGRLICTAKASRAPRRAFYEIWSNVVYRRRAHPLLNDLLSG